MGMFVYIIKYPFLLITVNVFSKYPGQDNEDTPERASLGDKRNNTPSKFPSKVPARTKLLRSKLFQKPVTVSHNPMAKLSPHESIQQPH
jgi:hypothetical protein